MWQEYVRDGEGVAVQTTVGQLLAQFNGTDGIKQVTLAPIEYVNYEEATMAGIEERDDTLAALKYKGTSWIHENEMRAILLYNMFYIAPTLPPNGEALAVPVNEFINRIILAPNATSQYEQRARGLIVGTPLEAKFTRSSA